MEYIKMSSTAYVEYTPVSAALAGITAASANQGIVFYSAKDAGVVAYLAAQAKQVETAELKITNKQSALAKIAKVAEKAGLPLTDEELAALQ